MVDLMTAFDVLRGEKSHKRFDWIYWLRWLAILPAFLFTKLFLESVASAGLDKMHLKWLGEISFAAMGPRYLIPFGASVAPSHNKIVAKILAVLMGWSLPFFLSVGVLGIAALTTHFQEIMAVGKPLNLLSHAKDFLVLPILCGYSIYLGIQDANDQFHVAECSND